MLECILKIMGNNNAVDKIGAPSFKQERKRKMKVSKSQALLFIFNTLMERGYLKKTEIIDELQISEVTFWRNIQEIRAFLCNFNLFYDLVYDRKENRYIFSNQFFAE